MTAVPDDATERIDAEQLRAALAVAAHLDIGEQLREILALGLGWAGGEAGAAFVLDPEAGTLRREACTLGADDPRVEVLRGVDPARAWEELREGAAVFEGLGPFAPPEGWPGTIPARSFAVALATPEAPFGVVLFFGPAPPPAEAQERIRRLLRLVRPALFNALQVRAIRDLVIKDDTAECFNRRYFDDFLVEELSRASRFRAPLSLIFFDMDNLKEVNSRLGHAMGSRSLHEVSVRVRGRIRKFDKLFRFGGDEFCIVLPETEWHGALEVAERVRESIATRPFLAGSPGAENGVRMTASFGIASYPLHARNKEDLVQRADRAMQRIKGGTKNSIAIAEIVREEHAN